MNYFNSLPPLINPSLLVENYAWVDERLLEMYNNYALTASNCAEYEAAGLLKEHCAWVDAELKQRCEITDIEFRPMPAPAPWVNYRSDGSELKCLEAEDEEEERLLEQSHTRFEFEISEYDEQIERNMQSIMDDSNNEDYSNNEYDFNYECEIEYYYYDYCYEY